MYRRVAELPLHSGNCPAWLFEKMKLLGAAVVEAIILEFGAKEVLRRLADPIWFQAFGCVLGFDWHSSGVTTTVCGALKAGIAGHEGDLGLFIAGGKARAGLETPKQIEELGDRYALSRGLEKLIWTSRIVAKVDTAAVQDGYSLYHHTFVFTRDGSWAIIQQGMNPELKLARRYHWLGELVSDFTCEPHAAVCCDQKGAPLNMVAKESSEARTAAVELANSSPEFVERQYKRILDCIDASCVSSAAVRYPQSHEIPQAGHLRRVIEKTYLAGPKDFTSLLEVNGVGPKAVRALALLSELVYGASPSFRDPARYSFAHGGKDGHPYRVDRATYALSIQVLERAISLAKIGRSEKLKAFQSLSRLQQAL